ncbi:uncharacterized protein PSANT_02392 [Moesziomyces antarcticus]|nr:uncharacterized protein PSANT_02392 [Moesziomyces antarcticus]
MDADRAAKARKHPQTAANFFVGTNSRVPRMTLAQTTHIIPLPAPPTPGLAPRSGFVPARLRASPFPSSPSPFTPTTPPRSAAKAGTKVSKAIEHFSRPSPLPGSSISTSFPPGSEAPEQRSAGSITWTPTKSKAGVGRADSDAYVRNKPDIPTTSRHHMQPVPSSERVGHPHPRRKGPDTRPGLSETANATSKSASRVGDVKGRSANLGGGTAALPDAGHNDEASATLAPSSHASLNSQSPLIASASKQLDRKQRVGQHSTVTPSTQQMPASADDTPDTLAQNEPSADQSNRERVQSGKLDDAIGSALVPLTVSSNLGAGELPMSSVRLNAQASTSSAAPLPFEDNDSVEELLEAGYLDLYSLPSSSAESTGAPTRPERVAEASTAMPPYQEPPANQSFDGNIADRADTLIGDQEPVSGRTVESSCLTSSSKSQWLSRQGGVLFDVSSESSARRELAGHPVSQSVIDEQPAGTDVEQDDKGDWPLLHPSSSSEAPESHEDDSPRQEVDDKPQAFRESSPDPGTPSLTTQSQPASQRETRSVHQEVPATRSAAIDGLESSPVRDDGFAMFDSYADFGLVDQSESGPLSQHARLPTRSDSLALGGASQQVEHPDHPMELPLSSSHLRDGGDGFVQSAQEGDPSDNQGLDHETRPPRSPSQPGPDSFVPSYDPDRRTASEAVSPASEDDVKAVPAETAVDANSTGNRRGADSDLEAVAVLSAVRKEAAPVRLQLDVHAELDADNVDEEDDSERQLAFERIASWVRETAEDLEDDNTGGYQSHDRLEASVISARPETRASLSHCDAPDLLLDLSGLLASTVPDELSSLPSTNISNGSSSPERIFAKTNDVSKGLRDATITTEEGRRALPGIQSESSFVPQLQRSFSHRSQGQKDHSKPPRKVPGRLHIPTPQENVDVKVRRQSIELLATRKARAKSPKHEPAALDPSSPGPPRKRSSHFNNALRMWSHPADDEEQFPVHHDRQGEHVGRMAKLWDDAGQSSEEEEVASVTVCKRMTLRRMSGFTVHSTPRHETPPLPLPGKLRGRTDEVFGPQVAVERVDAGQRSSLIHAWRQADAGPSQIPLEARRSDIATKRTAARAEPTSSDEVLGLVSPRSLGKPQAPLAEVRRQAPGADFVAESIEVLRSGDSVARSDDNGPGAWLKPTAASHRDLKQLQLPNTRTNLDSSIRADVRGSDSTLHTSFSERSTPNTSRAAASALTDETRISDLASSHLPSSSSKAFRAQENVAQSRTHSKPTLLGSKPKNRQSGRAHRLDPGYNTGLHAEHSRQYERDPAHLGREEPLTSSHRHERHMDEEDYVADSARFSGRQGCTGAHRCTCGQDRHSDQRSQAFPAFEISFQMQEPKMAPHCSPGSMFEFGLRVLIKPCGVDDAANATWRVRPPSALEVHPGADAGGRSSALRYEHNDLTPCEMRRVQHEAQEQLVHTLTSPRRRPAASVDIGVGGTERGLSSPFLSPGTIGASTSTSARPPLREMMLGSSRAASITTSRDADDGSRSLRTPATSVSRRVAPVLASPLPYIKRAPRTAVAPSRALR